MIQFEVTGGFSPEFLERVRSWANADPRKFADRCGQIVVDGNREGLIAGIDANGNEMAPVAESTIRRGRGGFGPPTVPRFSGSQLVDRFRVEVIPIGVRAYRLRGAWPGVMQVGPLDRGVPSHNMPARPLVGVRPVTRQKLRDEAKVYAQDLLKGDG